jgi:hypothetical protein
VQVLNVKVFSRYVCCSHHVCSNVPVCISLSILEWWSRLLVIQMGACAHHSIPIICSLLIDWVDWATWHLVLETENPLLML